MNDKNFLLFIANRLVHVHGDNENSDFIHKLKAIAAGTPTDKHTSNVEEKGQSIPVTIGGYNPQTLSWCKSYEEEVQELGELIEGKPADEKALRCSYQELTGKNYRRKN